VQDSPIWLARNVQRGRTTLNTTAMEAEDATIVPKDKRSPTFGENYVCPNLKVQKLSETATAPKRATAGAAGYDLCSAEETTVPAGMRKMVRTDLAIAVPANHYGRIAPRSGLATKKGIDIGAGVIDEDYRGPVGLCIVNNGTDDFEIKVGDRIAQLLLERIDIPDVEVVEKLDDTERGGKGFGSTGTSAATVS